jgi:hypothetical protein
MVEIGDYIKSELGNGEVKHIIKMADNRFAIIFDDNGILKTVIEGDYYWESYKRK